MVKILKKSGEEEPDNLGTVNTLIDRTKFIIIN